MMKHELNKIENRDQVTRISQSSSLIRSGQSGLIWAVIIFVLIHTVSVPCFASLLNNNLNATINLSGAQSTSQGITQTSFRQEINGNWFRNLSPYLTINGSASYFKTDFDRTHEIGLFKEEFSPSARISMNHPLVRFNANLTRTESTGSLLSEELVRKIFSADLQTKITNMPVLRAQYSQGTTRDNRGHRGKNIRDNNLGIGVTHDFGAWSGRYRMSRIGSKNIVTEFESISYQHLLQTHWSKTVFFKKPIKLSGDYLFNYRTQTDRLPQDSILRHEITPASGLYAEHQDAVLGWLEPQNDLTDHDVENPTNPIINIGTNSTNQHLGVELSVEQLVGGIYIYTDRLSDEEVSWAVYLSKDGLEWRVHDYFPNTFFNSGYNRYEIIFQEELTRYIKAISGGVNQIETVLVTEIVVLSEVASQGEVSQSNQSHRVNIGGTIQLNEKWKAGSELSFQRVPSVGLAGTRDNFSQYLYANYRPTEVLNHSFRFQTSLTSSEGVQADYSNYLLSYNIQYTPLPTLKLTGSSNFHLGRTNGNRETERINLSSNIVAKPVEDLSVELLFGYSWDQNQAASRRANSWKTRFSVNAQPSRTVGFRLSYAYRLTDVIGSPEVVPQKELFFKLTFRPFQKIHFNSQLTKTYGRHQFTQKLLSVSWNFSRAFTLTGQYRNSDDSEGYRSERLTANVSWRIGSRADIYLGYSKNKFIGTGTDTESLRAGLRMRI